MLERDHAEYEANLATIHNLENQSEEILAAYDNDYATLQGQEEKARSLEEELKKTKNQIEDIQKRSGALLDQGLEIRTQHDAAKAKHERLQGALNAKVEEGKQWSDSLEAAKQRMNDLCDQWRSLSSIDLNIIDQMI